MSASAIRAARPRDAAAIRAVLTAAFPSPAEADLVDALRHDGDLALTLVAEAGGEIRGMVAFSRLASPERALALAPLAVVPSMQRQGIGTALVEAGIALAGGRGDRLILVLGAPGFYGRFGFSAAAAQRYPSPYDGPHLMALALGGEAPAAAPAIYPPAFAGLG